MLKKYFYKNLKNLQNKKSIIIYHHLGLGDHIICAGLVNFISKDFSYIYLPVFERNFENVKYLFSDNKKIILFKVSNTNEKNEILSFAKNENLKILKVGFEYVKKQSFNLAFYNQLKLDYKISFDYFKLPEDTKRENELMQHLSKFYNVDISKSFKLIHATSSRATHPLRRQKANNEIFVEKDSDLFKNIFLYKKLILKASEIHCMNSSFIHIVERVPTNAKLFYHEVRERSSLSLTKNWNVVDYENPIT